MIWSLIVGGILGWLASLITGRDVPGGVIGNIIAGIIGSWIGGKLLGSFGPVIGGYAIIPALIGCDYFNLHRKLLIASNAKMNVRTVYICKQSFLYVMLVLYNQEVSALKTFTVNFHQEDNAKATTVHKLN